ncbi:MAG: RNA polymerase subunit sigma-70 [Kordiimonadales bacterium]|nr:MAG: RNA polymerase subunit sigma-70 [Kordiimonadales bacterium]
MMQSLITAAQSGSDYAFTRLVRLHQSSVRAFLRRLCKTDVSLADDLAQECFLKAHGKMGSYDGEGSFLSWLFGIAYRIFLDDYRKRKRRKLLDIERSACAPVESIAPNIDMKLDLERALSFLKIEERTAITLCLTSGMSHSEAAQIMDMPLGSVKSHIARGRTKLAEALHVWKKERLQSE